MNKRKFTIILYLIFVICRASLLSGCALAPNADSRPTRSGRNQNAPVERVIVNGVVESVESRNVYTTLGYMVNQIHVEVGDSVTEGQILAVLDTDDLELTIQQQRYELEMLQQKVELVPIQRETELRKLRQMAEYIPIQRRAERRKLQQRAEHIPNQRSAEIGTLQQSNKNAIQESQRMLNEAEANLANNTNIQILGAEAVLNTCESNLVATQRIYDMALEDYTEGKNPQVLIAESALSSAKIELDAIESDHESFESLYNIGGFPQNNLHQSEDALAHAQIKYNNALVSYESAVELEQRSLEQLETALDAATKTQQDAQTMLDATRLAAEQEIEILRNNVTASMIAADTEPLRIAADLESIDIKAGIDAMEIAANLELMDITSNLESMEQAIYLEFEELSTNLKRTEIALEILENRLEKSTITSPISGTVTSVIAKEGAVGTGCLFIVEDIDNLRVKVRIREYDINRIQTGMEVIITSDATGDTTHTGTISRIHPTASEKTAHSAEFEVEVAVTSQNTGLRIGMNTRIELTVE